jgi:leucine-rich PPR motif-containing protein
MKIYKCHPNVVTYISLIIGLWKVGLLKEACELFVEMKYNDCAPNTMAYNTLINGMGKAGEGHMACELFNEMKEKKRDVQFVHL